MYNICSLYVVCVHIRMYVCVHVETSLGSYVGLQIPGMCVYMYVCMFVYVCVWQAVAHTPGMVHVHTKCMNICIHVSMYSKQLMCVCVCVYIYIYIYIYTTNITEYVWARCVLV
jgi:hypothetical protein